MNEYWLTILKEQFSASSSTGRIFVKSGNKAGSLVRMHVGIQLFKQHEVSVR